MKISEKTFLLRFFLPSAFLLLCLALTSGIRAQTAIQYVPADATMVFTVNFKNLDKKVNLAQLQQYDFYNAFIKESSAEGLTEAEQAYFKEVMLSPANLGYDMLEPFYFFVKQEGTQTFLTSVVKLSDQAKYVERLRQLKGDKFQPYLLEKDGYHFWQDSTEAYAWNDQVVVNVWSVNQPAQPDYGYNQWNEADYSYEEYPVDTSVYIEEWVEEEDRMVVEIIEEPVMEEAPEADSTLLNIASGVQAKVFEELARQEEIAIEDEPLEDPNIDYHYQGGTEWDFLTKQAAIADWAERVMRRESFLPITTNANFRSAFETPHDMHFWMDYGSLMKNMQQDMNAFGGMDGSMQMMQMMQGMQGMYGVLNKDASLSAGLNFENGKMVMNTKMFFSPTMSNLYRGMMDGKFNKKMMRYIKGGDEMFGYMYLNFNVKKTIEGSKNLIYDILAQTPDYGALGVDAMQIAGIFIDEEAIGNLLRGDLLLAVSGMQTVPVKQTTYEWDADFNMTPKDTTILQTMPIFTMMASYGNEKDIMKFVKLGLHSGTVTQDGKLFKIVVPGSGIEIYLALKDGLLIFSNNRQMMLNRLDKGYSCKERISKKHRKLMKENATVMYWNIPNTIKAAAGDQSGSNIGALGYLNALGKEFESMEIIGSKTVTNSTSSVMNFNFVQKDANSLEQFFRFVNDIYLEFTGGAKI